MLCFFSVFVSISTQNCINILPLFSSLFQDLNFQPHEGLVDAVLEDVVYIKDFVRNSAAAALGIMLPEFEDITDRVLTRLLKMYSRNIEVQYSHRKRGEFRFC